MCCSSRDINFFSIEHVPIMMFFNRWHVPIMMFSNNDIFTGSNIDIAHGEHVLGASSLVDPYPGWMSAQLAKKGGAICRARCFWQVLSSSDCTRSNLTSPFALVGSFADLCVTFHSPFQIENNCCQTGWLLTIPPYQASSSWITWMEAHREEFKGVLRRWG